MKKFIASLALAFGILFAANANDRNVVTAAFQLDSQIENISADMLKDGLSGQTGVMDIRTVPSDNMVLITYDADRTNVDLLTRGLKNAGFNATEVDLDAKAKKMEEQRVAKRKHRAYAPDPENGKPAIKTDPKVSAAHRNACMQHRSEKVSTQTAKEKISTDRK